MFSKKSLLTDVYPPKKRALPEEGRIARKKSPFSFKKGLLFSFILLFLLGFFYFFNLAEAEIDIEPRTEFLSLSGEVAVPIKFFQKEKTVSENFKSSGKILKEGKAEGIITVYNEYSTSPQMLIATTRFVSADGKLFRTPTAVTIPGGRYEGGKFIPGELDIRIVSDQAGEDYNIGPSIFSIPGFAGTDRYTKFYGKSSQPMQGGFQQEIPQVMEEDLVEAENQLTERAISDCLNSLEEDIKSENISLEYICLSDEFDSQIVDKISLAVAGEEKEEFNFQVKASCQAMLAEKEIIKELAEGIILKESQENSKESSFIFVPNKVSIVESSLNIDHSLESLDVDAKESVLSLKISSNVYSEIDFYNLKNALSGKSPLEAEMFLESQPEIINASVFLSPFWVKKIPQDGNRIKLKINVD